MIDVCSGAKPTRLWAFLFPDHPLFSSARVAAPGKLEAARVLGQYIAHNVAADLEGRRCVCTFLGLAVVPDGPQVLELVQRR